jgi:aromatic-amino-acid transaminase
MKEAFNPFETLPEPISDPILGVTEAFRRDTASNKVNLGVGVYLDETGKTPILESIQRAAKIWTNQEDSKSYLPIEGAPLFLQGTRELAFGKDSACVADGRVASLQSVGGSGALRVGATFLKTFFPESRFFASDPTWDNHSMLFGAAGFQMEYYSYFDRATSSLNAAAMFSTLERLPRGTIVLVHGCCHNPTGVDLSKEDWNTFVRLAAERELIPFVDLAYQGLGDGLEQDAYGVRALAKAGLPFLTAMSFAKSFSIYRERVGALHIVCASADQARRVLGHTKRTVRTIYSSPNSWGAQLVAICLSDPELRKLWESEVGQIRNRIQDMRTRFHTALSQRIQGHDFSAILSQRGMFSFFGLTPSAIRALREKHHVYAIENGRVCVAALTPSNLEYVANAVADVWMSDQETIAAVHAS